MCPPIRIGARTFRILAQGQRPVACGCSAMKKHQRTSRRHFLRTGAAGIAGSAFLSVCSRPRLRSRLGNGDLCAARWAGPGSGFLSSAWDPSMRLIFSARRMTSESFIFVTETSPETPGGRHRRCRSFLPGIGGISCLLRGQDSASDRRRPQCVPSTGSDKRPWEVDIKRLMNCHITAYSERWSFHRPDWSHER